MRAPGSGTDAGADGLSAGRGGLLAKRAPLRVAAKKRFRNPHGRDARAISRRRDAGATSGCETAAKRHVRRGVVLVFVLMAMILVGGLLTMLAASGAERYRHRQADAVRNVARAVADSAEIYARSDADRASRTPQDDPRPLDVQELLPGGMTGEATLQLIETGGRRAYEVHVAVERGRYRIVEDRTVAVP